MRTPLFVYRLRKRLRRMNLALALGMAVVAGAGFVLLGEDRQDPPDGAGAPVSPVAAGAQSDGAVQASAKSADRMEAAVVEEMRQQPNTDLSSLPPFELPPPLFSIDGTGFRRGEEVIRLDRIAGPRAGEVCLDGTLRWSCGLQARAALHNLIAGRSLFCQPRRALAGAATGADCRLEAKDALPAGDVAHLLVGLGWAQPMQGNEAEFAADLERAKAAGGGLWRGGWRILPL